MICERSTLNVNRCHPITQGPIKNKKGEERWIYTVSLGDRMCFSWCWTSEIQLLWVLHSRTYNINFAGIQAFEFRLRVRQLLSWFWEFLDLDLNILLISLSFQFLIYNRTTSSLMQSNSFKKFPICLSISNVYVNVYFQSNIYMYFYHLLLVLSLWRTQKNR